MMKKAVVIMLVLALTVLNLSFAVVAFADQTPTVDSQVVAEDAKDAEGIEVVSDTASDAEAVNEAAVADGAAASDAAPAADAADAQTAEDKAEEAEKEFSAEEQEVLKQEQEHALPSYVKWIIGIVIFIAVIVFAVWIH